jgi:hypothetical protein
MEKDGDRASLTKTPHALRVQPSLYAKHQPNEEEEKEEWESRTSYRFV